MSSFVPKIPENLEAAFSRALHRLRGNTHVSARSGGAPSIVWARDGSEVCHVSEAMKGSDYECLDCGTVLRPWAPSARAWHFKHLNADRPCVNGSSMGCGEGLLHLLAKQVLLDGNNIKLREVHCPSIYPDLEKTLYGNRVGYTDPVPEKWESSFRPDVSVSVDPAVMSHSRDSRLHIEVCDTHKVDDVKRCAVRAAGVSMLEISIHHLRHVEVTKDQLTREVLCDAPRDWVFSAEAEDLARTIRSEEVIRLHRKCCQDADDALAEARMRFPSQGMIDLARKAVDNELLRELDRYPRLLELTASGLRGGVEAITSVIEACRRCSYQLSGSHDSRRKMAAKKLCFLGENLTEEMRRVSGSFIVLLKIEALLLERKAIEENLSILAEAIHNVGLINHKVDICRNAIQITETALQDAEVILGEAQKSAAHAKLTIAKCRIDGMQFDILSPLLAAVINKHIEDADYMIARGENLDTRVALFTDQVADFLEG